MKTNNDLLNLSKIQKFRLITLLICAITSGVFVALIFLSKNVMIYFWGTLLIGSLGISISAFWALIKGKKYDKTNIYKL